jgi:hypothetical protein
MNVGNRFKARQRMSLGFAGVHFKVDGVGSFQVIKSMLATGRGIQSTSRIAGNKSLFEVRGLVVHRQPTRGDSILLRKGVWLKVSHPTLEQPGGLVNTARRTGARNNCFLSVAPGSDKVTIKLGPSGIPPFTELLVPYSKGYEMAEEKGEAGEMEDEVAQIPKFKIGDSVWVKCEVCGQNVRPAKALKQHMVSFGCSPNEGKGEAGH